MNNNNKFFSKIPKNIQPLVFENETFEEINQRKIMEGNISYKDLNENEQKFFNFVLNLYEVGFITEWEYNFFRENWLKPLSIKQIGVIQKLYSKMGKNY